MTLSETLNFAVTASADTGKSADDCKIEKSVKVLKEDKSRFASINISTSEYSVHTSGKNPQLASLSRHAYVFTL